MKRLPKIIIILFVILSVAFAGYAVYTNSLYNIKIYPRPLKKFKTEINNNLSLSGKDRLLLQNQDRGFRGETYITLGTGKEYPSSENTAYYRLDNQIETFKDDGVQILQLYVYLIEYYDKPLDAKAFEQLTEYFKVLEKRHLKVLLRFAYEYSDYDKRGPTTEQIEEHCKQLKEWFIQNDALVDKTVYAGQLGVIGLWGEGHGSKYAHDTKRIIKAVADMFPEDIYLMVRTPEQLSSVPRNLEKRFGLHDDFLVGIDHNWGMLSFKHPQYQLLLNKCDYAICDGEMPWGRDTTVPDIDEKLLTKQIVNYALTTLSIEHNYKEEKDKIFHLEKYKNRYFDEAFFKDNGYPYNPYMLENGKISVYEYYQYHLGYLLGVSNFELKKGKTSFILNNFGMSAPFEYRLIVYADGERVDVSSSLKDLRRYGQLKITLDKSDIKDLRVVIKHNRSGDTVKLSNHLEYNQLGENILLG